MRFDIPAIPGIPGVPDYRSAAVVGSVVLLVLLGSLGSDAPRRSEAATVPSSAHRITAGKAHGHGATPPSRTATSPGAPSTDPRQTKGGAVPSMQPMPVGTARVDCRQVKCVALTFDDGPGPYTEKLLGMLAAHHARATFFLIGGNIHGREAIVRRELAEGHAIGDHSWSHPPLTTLSDDGIRSQLERTLTEIRRATGAGTAIMRPPYGDTNRRVGKVSRRLGMAQIMWSVDTNDWRDRDSHIVTHRAISWARRNRIILMHDIHPTTVDAVPAILTGLARRGYTFVTIPELFASGSLTPGTLYFDGPAPPHTPSPTVPRPESPRPESPRPQVTPGTGDDTSEGPAD